MHSIDWAIMVLPLVICACIAIYARRYVRSVADFMAGGRNAGRYLLSTARSSMGAGAVSFVAIFQMFAICGFAPGWWGQIAVPVGILVAVSGFVSYRYRQTRAMTIGQFFEMRYSRNFRLFAGGLAFFAGLLNFGIIPVIGARFMVYFLDLPRALILPDGCLHYLPFLSSGIPTHLLLMALFLAICTAMTTLGGQITVLLTDCAEGMFCQIFYVFIAVMLAIGFFHWADTKAVLLATEPGKSFVNPFDSFSVKDFNIWFVLMGIIRGVYGTMAWQNSHAFNSSGASPHENRMGGILGNWRGFAANAMITMLGVCALTYLNTPEGGRVVQEVVSKIPDPGTASQMRMPIALSHMLPMGAKGALVAICLMGIIAGDGIHLHSWSSIFIQDVVVPLRKNPLTVKQHLRLLRLAIVGVACFAFLFGAFFPQTEKVILWWLVTEAIYIGGAGAAIIGGLYWKRGTIAGAWVGFVVGSLLSVGGIGVRLYFQQVLHQEFPFNGQQIGFFAMVVAVISYVVVSLLTCRQPHNMDRLLHRGEYAVEPEAGGEDVHAKTKQVGLIYRLVGIDGHFTRSDRWLALGIFGWSILWFVVFLLGTTAYLIHPWSDGTWANYWLVVSICLPLVIGVVTTIWFTIGCWHDMRVFFSRLRVEPVDVSDDGTVACNEKQ